MPLTARQQEILAVLREHAEHASEALTLRQLCAHLGVRSRGSLRRHLRALAEAGLVEPQAIWQRGIRVLPEPLPEDHLPLLGRIAAGRPIEAVVGAESIQVPAALRTTRPCYVLQVVGDSMREAGILDGDYVVIEHCAQARNGVIVVALIGGQEATLKRIYQEPGRITLRAENPAVPPLEYPPDNVEIQGILVGQMRRYR
ncbi:MAG TPA: transcriptional repressor LexA [Lamprocystis sp. (in: g-proteobacteria)]|nr:transcriptional repressor LexA [Lamprocystis sp. (in: g-proteobacteria)]